MRNGVHAVSQIFTSLKKGDSYEAITTAELAAKDIVEKLELINDEMFYTYKELRDYLKNTRIVISEEDAASIPDFKEFKKEQAGRIRIVSQNGVPVDTVYPELVEKYPELFSSDITHPADQLIEMADVRESLEPYDIMLSAEETEQLVKQTAQDLLDIAGHGKAFKSWADKKAEQYDEKLRLVKARHKEALRDIRRNERERAERLIQGERQKWADRVNRANERGNRRVQEEKGKTKAREAKKREEAKRRESIRKMENDIKWLSDRLLKPTDDKHIPEGARKEVARLLFAIDTQSERSKKLQEKYGLSKKRIKFFGLKQKYYEIFNAESNSDFIVDQGIVEEDGILDELHNKLDEKELSEATSEDLEMIRKLLKNIVHGVRNQNNAFSD